MSELDSGFLLKNKIDKMSKYIYTFLIWLRTVPTSNTVLFKVLDAFLNKVSEQDLDKVMAFLEFWLEKLKKRHAESLDGKK
jgi:hypothetical protein